MGLSSLTSQEDIGRRPRNLESTILYPENLQERCDRVFRERIMLRVHTGRTEVRAFSLLPGPLIPSFLHLGREDRELTPELVTPTLLDTISIWSIRLC